MATSKASLKVELPKPGEDKPRFSRVGIITAVGFGLGVLWPRLAGVHLVPSAPAEEVAGVSSAAEEAAPAGSGSDAARRRRRPRPHGGAGDQAAAHGRERPPRDR